LLDHFVEDPKGTVYKVDAAHPAPDPGFVTGAAIAGFEGNFLAALNKTPSAELTRRLTRPGQPDVTSFTRLTLAPYTFSVALADLTGDETDPTSKVFHPPYVASRDHDSLYPASLMKIAPILAAHQLKFDALQKAKLASAAVQADPAKLKNFVYGALISDWAAKGIIGKKQRPDLRAVLDADSTGIIFDKNFMQFMMMITHPDENKDQVVQMNKGMAELMERIHAPYMGSVFLQLGLCDNNTGGMWMYNAWGEKWPCKGGVTKLYKGQAEIEVQAKSAVTYLTLMKQRRLVSPDMSDQMQDVLIKGDLKWAQFGLAGTLGPAEVVGLKIWGKHGAFGGHCSEALLVERTTSQGKQIRYVVACFLTSTASVKEYPVARNSTVYDLLLNVLVDLLIPALDGVIVANNP